MLKQLQALLQGSPKAVSPRDLTLEKRYDYSHGRAIDDKLTYYRGIKPDEEGTRDFLRVAREGDKLGPALMRFVAGTLGLDPEWTIKRNDSDVTSDMLGSAAEKKATPEEKTIAAELNALEDIHTVWDKGIGLHKKIALLYHTSLWAELGYFRLYIPDSLKEDPRVQRRTFKTVQEALSVIYLNILDPRVAGAIVDEHGDTLGYYYRYEDEKEDGSKRELIELYTPDEIKLLEANTQTLEEQLETANATPNPLRREGERPDYLMGVLEHPQGGALDASVIDEQDSLNESKVEMRRNGQMGGHRQLITINAAEPVDETGKPVAYQFGAAVVANITGVPIYNHENKIIGMTDPKVIVVEPVNPENFIVAIKHHTAEILQRYSQQHFESEFLAISGESKRESREAWISNLELESGPIGAAYAHILRNALRYAYWLTGKNDNAFDVYEVVPVLNLNVSNADIDTVMKASDLVTAGHMTLENFVLLNDLVKSKDAELAALNEQTAVRDKADAERARNLLELTPPEPTV